MSEGWIKLHRKMLDWEWYTDANTFRLMLHCLFKANFKAKKWQGIEVERGSFITSYKRLSAELNISVQSIRTSIKRLKSTRELTIKNTPKYSLISITNYDLYQEANTLPNTQLTRCQHTANTQLTTTKNVKNNKNEKTDTKHPPLTPPSGGMCFPEGFDDFWSAYPNKKGKGQAVKAWDKIKPDKILINSILMALRDQIDEKKMLRKHDKFCPEWKNPSTWLNGQCWEDGLSSDYEILREQENKLSEWLGDSNVIKGEFHVRD